MTELNSEQFDRVARWLDGEQILLTDTERELADDFLCNEKALGDVPATPLPSRWHELQSSCTAPLSIAAWVELNLPP